MVVRELRISETLALSSLALVGLFVALEPASSSGLSLPMAALHWSAHIGIGVLLCWAATWLLLRMPGAGAWPAWRVLGLAGMLGSLAFAPLAVLIEGLTPRISEPPDGWLDRLEASPGLAGLFGEWLQLLPEFVAGWMLLNAPPLLGLGRRATLGDAAAPSTASRHADAGDHEPATGQGAEAEPDRVDVAGNGLLARLPPAIGTSIVTASADLHYLHVRTLKGRATVLGTLDEAEDALGADALRIHRAHVVAATQVRRVLRRGTTWLVETRTGQKLPVSRRRVAELRERLGTGFVVEVEAETTPA